MNLRWESKLYHVWNILKEDNILTFPIKTKYVTKEDKEYSEENKSLKMDEKEKIIPESPKTNINYLENINFSFNFMRNCFIIVDMSENSILVDFKPNRVKYIFYKLKKFIKDYFSYNYISSMTIIITHNCTSEILSPFSRDPEEIINNIDTKIFGIQTQAKNNSRKSQIKPYIPGGYFSLYNSLEAIKDIISSKMIDHCKNDILIINNSLLTYDNNIKNDILFYFKDKYEINVISLELPFESLKELAINSGGTLLQIKKEKNNINYYNTNGDMDEFLFYYSSKYSSIKNEKVVKPIKQRDTDMNPNNLQYICFCHKKYQKVIYLCPECKDPYCYIPFYCTKCFLLNIDNTYIQLLIRAKNDKENKNKINNKCFPYKFTCYYQNYLENDYYLKNVKNALIKLKVHEKEFKRITRLNSLNNISYDYLPFDFKFKLLYHYIKFEKSRQNFFCDLKKNVLEENYADYIDTKKALILKDNIRCCGCNNIFDVKEKDDFDDIIIYSNCLDIFCLECYKYLINNNIGCLECTD